MRLYYHFVNFRFVSKSPARFFDSSRPYCILADIFHLDAYAIHLEISMKNYTQPKINTKKLQNRNW